MMVGSKFDAWLKALRSGVQTGVQTGVQAGAQWGAHALRAIAENTPEAAEWLGRVSANAQEALRQSLRDGASLGLLRGFHGVRDQCERAATGLVVDLVRRMAAERKQALDQLRNLRNFRDLRNLRNFVEREIGYDLETVVRNPRALGARLEQLSPRLNRFYLSAVSGFLEPALGIMDLRVERLTEDLAEVWLVGRPTLRPRSRSGADRLGALASLGEFTARVFWEHHLDLRETEVFAERVQVQILGSISGPMSAPMSGDLRAIYRISIGEREAVLHRLRSEMRASLDSTVSIYDSNGLLVAEADLSLGFRRFLILHERNQTDVSATS